MKRDKELQEALSDCLDRLLRGVSVEDCLRLYPSLAADLAPLLQVAFASLKATAHLRSTPEMRARILAQVLAQRRDAAPRRRWLPQILRPWLLAPTAAVLLLGAFWGVSTASANSAPGDALYPVKTFRERVSLALARSPEAKARLATALARQRAEEMDKLISRGKDGEALEGLFHRMAVHARQAAAYWADIPTADEEATQVPSQTDLPPTPAALSPSPRAIPLPPGRARREAVRLEVRRELLEHLQVRDARWQEALRRAPPQARPSLEQAYHQWRQQIQEVLQALDNPPPRPVPPQRPGHPIPPRPRP
ncbi:MAG: DUF5667 domain-containing protein [Dehalococcoidia bacterium]|nr:DUF5667 domain-containing protein [Dehalococcoidia bacterium]MDW8119332.1 DUF5667 domain-containing protein [Chloroflexota bacterium]